MTPGFHFTAIKEAVPYVVEEASRFVGLLKSKQGQPMEAKKVFTSVTLRVIIKTAFGGDFDPTWMEVIIVH